MPKVLFRYIRQNNQSYLLLRFDSNYHHRTSREGLNYSNFRNDHGFYHQEIPSRKAQKIDSTFDPSLDFCFHIKNERFKENAHTLQQTLQDFQSILEGYRNKCFQRFDVEFSPDFRLALTNGLEEAAGLIRQPHVINLLDGQSKKLLPDIQHELENWDEITVHIEAARKEVEQKHWENLSLHEKQGALNLAISKLRLAEKAINHERRKKCADYSDFTEYLFTRHVSEFFQLDIEKLFGTQEEKLICSTYDFLQAAVYDYLNHAESQPKAPKKAVAEELYQSLGGMRYAVSVQEKLARIRDCYACLERPEVQTTLRQDRSGCLLLKYFFVGLSFLIFPVGAALAFFSKCATGSGKYWASTGARFYSVASKSVHQSTLFKSVVTNDRQAAVLELSAPRKNSLN